MDEWLHNALKNNHVGEKCILPQPLAKCLTDIESRVFFLLYCIFLFKRFSSDEILHVKELCKHIKSFRYCWERRTWIIIALAPALYILIMNWLWFLFILVTSIHHLSWQICEYNCKVATLQGRSNETEFYNQTFNEGKRKKKSLPFSSLFKNNFA